MGVGRSNRHPAPDNFSGCVFGACEPIQNYELDVPDWCVGDEVGDYFRGAGCWGWMGC
jgi:hypothetical protein